MYNICYKLHTNELDSVEAVAKWQSEDTNSRLLLVDSDGTYNFADIVGKGLFKYTSFLENFNRAYNFWTVSARALIFHMSIPCDKTFQWVPIFLTLWP